jgi:hypothetical protein
MLQRCEGGLCGVPIPRRLLQEDIYDQYSQLRDGYCFLDDPENGLNGLQLDTRLVRHLMNSRSGDDPFFDEAVITSVGFPAIDGGWLYTRHVLVRSPPWRGLVDV